MLLLCIAMLFHAMTCRAMKFGDESLVLALRPQYLRCDGLGFGPGSPAARPRAGRVLQGMRCRGTCRGAATPGEDCDSGIVLVISGLFMSFLIIYRLLWCVVLMLRIRETLIADICHAKMYSVTAFP